MTDVLNVERREGTGSSASRKLRLSGKVPVVLYGHGQDNEHLAVPVNDVKMLLRHHSKMVELKGAVSETALVNEMHFDPLGIEVLHLDLQRVDLNQRVQVTVTINIHGEPKGTREGGMFLENQHQVDISCPAGDIPESLTLNVAELGLGENMTASQLELPNGVELVSSDKLVLCSVVAPKGKAKEGDGEADAEAEAAAEEGGAGE